MLGAASPAQDSQWPLKVASPQLGSSFPLFGPKPSCMNS